VPGISTATFALLATPELQLNTSYVKVASKTLPAGSWAAIATLSTSVPGAFTGDDIIRDLACELRNGTAFIGGATDRRVIPPEAAKRSLAITGGAFIPSGSAEVSLWCSSQNGSAEEVDGAQIMFLQVGGFS
jgi:hypothetical protein